MDPKAADRAAEQLSTVLPGVGGRDLIQDFGGPGGGEAFVRIKYLDGNINLSVKRLFKLSFVSRETEEDNQRF